MLVLPQVGALEFLQEYLTTYGTSAQYHLYQNNITPGQATVLADFVEADFSGYAGGINAANWSAPVIVSGHAKALANMISWTHNGGGVSNNIYGYYVLAFNGALLWAERDPNAPRLMQPGSPPYQLIPALTSISEFL
jgi:hypothetical protein